LAAPPIAAAGEYAASKALDPVQQAQYFLEWV
jgi:hypothetical protein